MRWLVALVLIFPLSSHAAVTINEVAWMGSIESANHEWIELYNDGTNAVDVTDWVLSDDMNLSITLSGSIPAGGYAVLERSSEASSPASAFLIYTGALVNTGATLRLLRSDGGLEDQVAGGSDWKNIGGDNTTKETAQYTSGGWITAEETAGRPNEAVSTSTKVAAVTNVSNNSNGNNGTAAVKRSSSDKEALILTLPDVTLQLEVDARTLGYVNQEVPFRVEASGIGDTLIDSLTYEWNFGDGHTTIGEEPLHRYQFPGTYLVTVYGSYKRQEQVARHEITILPVTLSLTRNNDGDLQINNDSPYEIDISGYTVSAFKEFVFAPRSIMLSNQTVTLKGSSIGGTAKVFDEEGELVVKEGQADSPKSLNRQC